MEEDPGGDADELSTLARPKFDPSPLPDGSFELTVIEGADLGRTFTLDASQPARVLVGQSPACEFRLSDRAVSRRHAALDLAGRRVRLTDLGSTNGTHVDGVMVVEALLGGGEIVRMGATAFRLDARPAVKGPAVPAATRFGCVIGASTEMRRLYPLCDRLAASTLPVVIEGETGTGKELLAEAIHAAGPRGAGPFVVFDCTAVPPNLVESALFGHEAGAFTGAISMRKGVFEQAHGGTLLIDEIGDLETYLQPKLLRALERSEVCRVGGERFLKVDVRVLAATRRDLDREVQAGRFRDDLFHRLAVARIELPPLRRRRGDITVLARHFCREIAGDEAKLPGDLLLRWEDLPWPGNLRELRNAVARHLVLGELALAPREGMAAEASPSDDYLEYVLSLGLTLPEARQRLTEEFERRYVERVLSQHGGNVARAANASGVARRYFYLLRARAAGK